MANILIGGAGGFIGTSLSSFLTRQGHAITVLTRKKSSPSIPAIFWDPSRNYITTDRLSGFDVVIHLGGRNIIAGRWTKKMKAQLRSSRVDSTLLLAQTMAAIDPPPRLFISASAVGYYGDCGSDLCDESRGAGTGFLANLCYEWENAARIIADHGVRTVNLRLGMVLGKEGGSLKMMGLPWKWGLGAVLGDGNQYMSWISIMDVCRLIDFIIATPALAGPINLVAPDPVTNREFSKTLGAVLRRPVLFRIPRMVLSLLLGHEMAEEIFLSSVRAVSLKLQQAGYNFHHPKLQPALVQLITP